MVRIVGYSVFQYRSSVIKNLSVDWRSQYPSIHFAYAYETNIPYLFRQMFYIQVWLRPFRLKLNIKTGKYEQMFFFLGTCMGLVGLLSP